MTPSAQPYLVLGPVATRNAHLAALRSFVRYLVDWLGPELPDGARRILTIPFKRQVRRLVGFLTPPEIEAALAATDQTWTGRRDHLLILLLFHTGARISELLALRVQDVAGTQANLVELQGKGRKHRTLPLWRQTRRLLRQWIRESHLSPSMPLLLITPM
jgi:integrase/recombinase XerD